MSNSRFPKSYVGEQVVDCRSASRRTLTLCAASGILVGLLIGLWPARASQGSVPPAAAAAERTTCSGTGLVWWNELLSPDIEKLADFYSKVIGWKPRIVDVDDQTSSPTSPEDRYTLFVAGEQIAAGLMKPDHPSAIHSGIGWFTYIQVSDVAKALAAAKAAGGTIIRDQIESSEGALMAVVRDPMGNVFGLVAPSPSEKC